MKNYNVKIKARLIALSMHRLRQAFEAIMEPSIAEELAFHLADLKPEFITVARLLGEVEKTGTINPDTAYTILAEITVHWPYHLNEIRKLVDPVTLSPETFGVARKPSKRKVRSVRK